MIKIALKHFIFDKCIDVLFDAIGDNFSLIPKRFKVGDRFSYIQYIWPKPVPSCAILYNAEIVSIVLNDIVVECKYLDAFSVNGSEHSVSTTAYGETVYRDRNINTQRHYGTIRRPHLRRGWYRISVPIACIGRYLKI